MLMLRACPRCRGDVARIDELNDDVYFTCLQCGFVAYRWPPSATADMLPAA